MASGYVEYRCKRYRIIPDDKVLINKRTPPGDDAIFYECMPYGGRREFDPLFYIKQGIISKSYRKQYNYDLERWEVIVDDNLLEYLEENEIEMPDQLNDRTYVMGV